MPYLLPQETETISETKLGKFLTELICYVEKLLRE